MSAEPGTGSPGGNELGEPAGRERAVLLARGICRLFAAFGWASVCELTLVNGRRIDVAAIGPGGEIHFVEIKTSVADFRADRKWDSYADFCDRLYFAVPVEFPLDLLPETTGLIVADAYGGEVLREAPVEPLNAARRKAVLLRFAHHAAWRLQRHVDPEGP